MIKHLTLVLFAASLAMASVLTRAAVPAPRSQEAVLPEGPGKAKVMAMCAGECHDIGAVVAKRGTEQEWRDTIALMVDRGATGSPEDMQAVLAYLTKHLGPQAAPPAAPRSPSAAAAPSRAAGATPGRATDPGAGVRQWPNYQHNSNFSPLTTITPANVKNLAHAWTFNYGAGSSPAGGFVGLDFRFEVQPLLIGGVMYISTPASQNDPNLRSTITALEPETGKVIWQYESPRRIHGRGLAYWPGSSSVGPRLYAATDQGYLIAVDMKTGTVSESFGDKGWLDVYAGVVSPEVGESRRSTYSLPNPVAVYKNLLIAGARPGEAGPPQPRGDIRAFDAVTGKLVWAFHVIPQEGEPNFGTWRVESLKDRSGANMWSTMTVDEPRGIVFAGLGDANRPGPPGNNLYTGSLIALDANTGKLKWFHQIVHHDIWDMDMPTPPILVDVRRGNRTIPAVLLTGKLNLVFIFNRDTGEPLYGMEERPVPQSGGRVTSAFGGEPNTFTAPTQPFPQKPGPIGRMGMTRADINKITPEVEKFCTDFWDQNKIQPSQAYSVFTGEAAMVTFPSSLGGANWGPLSYNPQLGYVYVNVQNTGTYRPAGDPVGRGGRGGDAEDGGRGGRGGRNTSAGPASGQPAAAASLGAAAGARVGGPFAYPLSNGAAMPCWAPPYGELLAIDVNRGEIAWRSTLGVQEWFGELGDAAVKVGARNLGGSIATAGGLVFIGATNDRRFRAFDAKSGAELWSTTLPASAHSTPITYMGRDGAQYVVIAAGGGTAVGSGLATSDALVAFRLSAAIR